MDCSDGERFRERHRFVRWVEVLGRQGRRRGWVFLASPRVWGDRELVRRVARNFIDRRFREKFVGIGGIGWWRIISEEDVGGRKLLVGKCCDAEKIFFGRRAILGRGRSGSEKNVRAREIVGWWRRETGVKEILLLRSFTLSVS